jgi:hypothetical protein
MRAAMGLLVVLIVTGAALQYFGKSETRTLVGQRAVLGDLRPPAMRLLPASSSADFFRKVESARQRVDEALLREPPPGGGLSDGDSPE